MIKEEQLANNKQTYEAERVKLLMKKNVSTLALAVVSSILFFFVFKKDMNPLSLFFIVLPYSIFSLIRYFLCEKFWKLENITTAFDYERWEDYFSFLTLLSGLSFGMMVFWCFTKNDYISQIFCIAVALGYSSGANNAYSASMKTVIMYTISVLGSLVLSFIFKGGESVHIILSVMTILFFLNGIVGAKNINEMIRQHVENKFNSIHLANMNVLGDMAAGMAHEINNPLTIMNGQITYLRNRMKSNEMDKTIFEDRLERLSQNIKRISIIINGLTQYSSTSTDKELEVVDIKNSVEKALDFCSAKLAEKIISTEVECLTEKHFIKGRSFDLKQAFISIINNSIDAISSCDEKWIKIKISQEERQLIIRFTDSGKGIPEDIVEKIMLPFFTTKDIGQGLGLGLSTASGIIRCHQGELAYDSSQINTSFVISFSLS